MSRQTVRIPTPEAPAQTLSVTRPFNAPLALILLAFLFLSASYAWRSAGIFSADDVSHYLKARYVWSHSYLLSDIWGRPAYTILSSPLAHFGIRAARWFNILVSLLACCLASEIARALGFSRPWMAAAFTATQPPFLQLSYGTLTEPLFGLLLAAAVLFYQREKLAWSSLMISLLPAARLEGFLFLGLWFLLLVWRRRFGPVLVLLLFPLLWDAGGMAVTGDPLFLWNYNPYRSAAQKLSPGHWFDYLFQWPTITGPAVLPMLTLGLLCGLLLAAKSRFVCWVTILYVALQVAAYGSGVLGFIDSNEAFYLRFFVGIAPLLGVIAAQGEDCLFGPARRNFRLPAGLHLMLAVAALQAAVVTLWYFSPGSPVSVLHLLACWFVFIAAMIAHRWGWMGIRSLAGVVVLLLGLAGTLRWARPNDLRVTDKIWADVGWWFMKGSLKAKPVIVLDPSFWPAVPRDPFDLSGLEPFYIAKGYRALKTSLPMAAPGTIVVWDSHFFGRDAGMAADFFTPDRFQLLQYYSTSSAPGDRFFTRSEEGFQVAVFEKK